MSPHKSIIARLRSHQDQFSPKLLQLAKYVIANPQHVQLQSITDLANNSKTSDATVFRLCKELGYSGYAQFKMALAIELSQPQTYDEIATYPAECLTQQCAQGAIQALQDTATLLDQRQLDKAVDLLHNARVIYCIGLGSSNVVGRYFIYRLLRIGKSVVMFEDSHMAAMQAANPQPGDCWIAVSSSGSSKEVVFAAEVAHDKKTPVIALCNVLHSPLAKAANTVLVAANPEGPLSGGAFSSKVGALLIIDSIIMHLIKKSPGYKKMIQQSAEKASLLLL